MTENGIMLHIDRDRVHAGDDEFPPFHMIRVTHTVRGDATVGEALGTITHGRDRYSLASVEGGATWVLYGGPADSEKSCVVGRGSVALAVIAGSIEETRMVVDPGLALSSLAGTDGGVKFYFRYLQRADPQQTWQSLRDE